MARAARLLCFALLLSFVGGAFAGDEFMLGFSTHHTSPAELAMIRRTGVRSIRDDIRWQWIEQEKGKLEMGSAYEQYVDQALKQGLEPLLILDYGNPHYDGGDYPRSPEAIAGFVRFCEFVVRHFRGRVFRYEIWNEWNVGTDMKQPGDAAEYVALLARSYAAIKKLAPEVTVLGGAMSGNGLRDGWVEAACRAGMLESLDGLSFHPYCWGAEGEERMPDLGLVKRVRDLETVLEKFPRGKAVPLYVTEIGWPTHRGANAATEEEAAAYFARSALLLAAMPRVRGTWWYGWSDNGEDSWEYLHRFGVVTPDLRPKPALAAATQVGHFLRAARSPLTLAETPNTRTITSRDSRGRPIVAAWTLRGRKTLRLFADRSTAGLAVEQSRAGSTSLKRSWERRGRGSFLRVTVESQPTFLLPRGR